MVVGVGVVVGHLVRVTCHTGFLWCYQGTCGLMVCHRRVGLTRI
jgi:hypothetical protein